MIGITRPDEKVSTLSFLTLMGLSEHIWTCTCLSSVSDRGDNSACVSKFAQNVRK